MSFRPLIFAVPATALFSLVAAAGLAWTSPASALDSGSDDPLEMAQATPPAAPPPAAGGQERRERAAFNPKAFCLDPPAHPAGARAYLQVRLDPKPQPPTARNRLPRAPDPPDAHG